MGRTAQRGEQDRLNRAAEAADAQATLDLPRQPGNERATRTAASNGTDMNGEFLEAIAAVATASDNAELQRDSTAYLAFLQAKEQTGIERAQLSAVFGTDRFEPGQFATVVSLIAARDAYLDLFLHLANPEVLAAFDVTQGNRAVAETARLEAVAIENGDRGFGVESTAWFQTVTERINLLKEVEDFQTEAILARSDEIAGDAGGWRRIGYGIGPPGTERHHGARCPIGRSQIRRLLHRCDRVDRRQWPRWRG